MSLESRLASPSVVLGLALASLLGIAIVGVGASVTWLRPANPAARLLLVFALALAVSTAQDLWHWSQHNSGLAVALDQLTGAALYVAAAALLHLFLIFPASRPVTARVRRLLPVCYALALLPVLMMLSPATSAWAAAAGTVVLVGLLFGALIALESSYRRPSTPLTRAQLGWIRWGLAVGAGTTLLARLAGLLVPDLVPALMSTLVSAAWLVFPISLGFAVLRYRLFEVDRVVRASILWGLLAALLLSCYLAIVVLGGRLAATLVGQSLGGGSINDPTLAVVAVLMVAVAVHPLRLRLQRALDRHVYRDRFARQQLLAAATDLLSEPRSAAEMVRLLCREVPLALRLGEAWFAVPRRYAVLFEVEPQVLLPGVSLAAPALLEVTGEVGEPVLLACPEDLDAYRSVSNVVVSTEEHGVPTWYGAGARVVVGIQGADGALFALWVLGAPITGDLFDRDDLQGLSRLATMVGMQLERDALRVEPVPRVRLERAPSADMSGPDQGLGEGLTAREREVLRLLARGYSNRQIADELIIGLRTAETHVQRVLHKLELDNRAQAIAWAHDHALALTSR
jgi:DNA-binding CsgD family transcriptional regulator